MSHELRTPLNAVIGFGQVLEMGDLTPDQRDSVKLILEGGRHLLGLIGEILDISRIEAGRLAFTMESVDLKAVVTEAVELIAPMATKASIAVNLAEHTPCARYVWADRQRMLQVLMNLLSNAVKYNKPHGTVTVSCRPAGEGFVDIAITDTGIGIAHSNLERIFRPFDRLGAERTDIEGTGIGLTLADGLARAMGGYVHVQSEEGIGSTFSLGVAIADSPPLGEPAIVVPNLERATRGVVLYVEDSHSSLELMKRVLALRPGVQLVLAASAEQGLAVARTQAPLLAFVDLHLPDMAGDELIRHLRAEGSVIPIVAVTADASSQVRDRLLESGATAVLTKPFDVRDVLAWVDKEVAVDG